MRAKQLMRMLGVGLFCATLTQCDRPPAQGPVGAKSTAAVLVGGPVGVVCTTQPGTSPIFALTTQVGYISLPDGNTMYMWGYSEGGREFQHPGPVLCVNQGDLVTVVLQNTFAEPVSIIFPGQEGVLADGSPAQPQFSGATLTSLTTAAPPGGTVSYQFTASTPGVFLYESGTEPHKQVRMGLFGSLVVRPTLGAGYVNNRADSQFTPAEEFMVMLSEIDPYQHMAAEAGAPFDLTNYKARYWLVNGRAFPDTVVDNFAPFLPSQPYGAMGRIRPFNANPAAGPNYHPLPGRVKYLNVGSENFPFHPHAHHGRVVARDGRPLEGPAGEDLSFEKFAINIGPSQTWDVLFKWYDAEGYDRLTNPVPVVLPNIANVVFGEYYSGSPYLGETGPLQPGKSTLNQCGEYYVMTHNHALQQLTSWGMTASGAMTYLRIEPPLPNLCP